MKAGFNVDRILNQQREERLRLQAEAVRDREKAAAEAASDPSASIRDDRDDQSIMSDTTAVDSDTGPPSKTRSLLDKLKRSSLDPRSNPGAFPNLTERIARSAAGSLTQFGGPSNADGGVMGPGGGGQTTKRVSGVICRGLFY